MGGNNPIVIQSMTSTSTKDIEATTQQIKELANAGSELVRITVNDDKAAEAVPKIINNLKDI
jgi:(E)-4-hydroxy-3-methylbut-2-enyl-diphosphate synthase